MREKRVIVISASSAALSNDIINSIRGTPFSIFKSRLFLLVIFSLLIHTLLIYYINSIKVSTEESILIDSVPERFARLIIEKPLPKKVPQTTRSDQQSQAGEQKATQQPQTQSQTESAPITTAQRSKAKVKVQAQVNQVEQKVRTVGVLGMLTGVGATAKGPAVADVLGAIGDKKDKFQDLDDALNKMSGLKKTPSVDILDRKLVKSKEVSISHKEEIDDLIAGVGQAESVNLSKKGDFIIQRPESIEGAASSDARIDNNAINEIVSSHNI